MKRPRTLTFKPNADGTKDVTITFFNVTLKPDTHSRIWRMIDHVGVTKQYIDCGGVRLKAKLVVKLYCKMPEMFLGAIQKKRVWQSIRTHSPLVM